MMVALHLLAQAMPLDPGRFHILHPGAPQGSHIEWLYWVIFWICFAVYVLMIVGFARAGAKAKSDAIYPLPVFEDEEGDQRAKWAVGTAVAVTVVTLFVVLILSVVTGKQAQGLNSKNPVTIQVIGHQWWWEVVYPNTQADQTVTTANEIHIPVGVPVVINSTSRDVIHSFWAPNIHGKRDLLPGYNTAVWIQADQEGRFRGQCAEFCGHQHAHMAFFIVAESPEKFQAWFQQQVKPAADPTDPLAKRGEQIFTTHTCVMCHTIRGTDAGSRVGPELTHLASRETIAAGTLPNNVGNLAGWVLDPQAIKPGTRMPPNPMTSEDLQALLAYLQTLR